MTVSWFSDHICTILQGPKFNLSSQGTLVMAYRLDHHSGTDGSLGGSFYDEITDITIKPPVRSTLLPNDAEQLVEYKYNPTTIRDISILGALWFFYDFSTTCFSISELGCSNFF
jgi:hypothetical protein